MDSESSTEVRLRHQLDVQTRQIDRVLSRHRIPASVSGGEVRPKIVSFDLQTQISSGLERIRGLKDDLMSALGVGEVKLTGMVRPDRKLLTYRVNFTKALQTRRLTMGVADGIVEADGDVIYIVKDMKVALSES